MPARRLMPADRPRAELPRPAAPAALMLGLAALMLGAACRKQPEAPRPASLKGRVVSANGRALPDVELRVLSPDKLSQIVRDGKTAPDGTFLLEAIPAGRYLLRGELPGFSSAAVPVTLASGESIS